MKVAVVGCGLIAARKYIPILQRLRNKATIVAVCDRDETVLKQVTSKFRIKNAYQDFSEMLRQAGPDVVVVCTPPATHTKLVIEALQNRAHVLVEKPMALTSADCREMVDASHRHGRRLGVMHNQVFNPAFERACERVGRGAIGKFLGMRIFLMTPADDMTTNPNHWAHRLPGGMVGETGPHAVYLSLALLDKVTDVQLRTKKLLPQYSWSAAEDVRFDLVADNGISSVALMYGSDQAAAEIEIIGTAGMLKVDLQSRILVDHRRTVRGELLNARVVTRSVVGSLYQTSVALAKTGLRYAWSKSSDGHYVGIIRFLDYVRGEAEYGATGEKAAETAAVLEVVIQKLQELQGVDGPSRS